MLLIYFFTVLQKSLAKRVLWVRIRENPINFDRYWIYKRIDKTVRGTPSPVHRPAFLNLNRQSLSYCLYRRSLIIRDRKGSISFFRKANFFALLKQWFLRIEKLFFEITATEVVFGAFWSLLQRPVALERKWRIINLIVNYRDTQIRLKIFRIPQRFPSRWVVNI